MKNIVLLLFFVMAFACSKSDTENNETPPLQEDPITTQSCLITDFDIQENSSIIIDCMLDLEGQTITIPNNVTFMYNEGGAIVNGTLSFVSKGKIDGAFLNSELNVEGDIQLTSTVFDFVASRWTELVEGKVADEVARNNRDFLEMLFLKIKNLGGDTFVIDNLDAYFKVDGLLSEALPTNQGINIPSDFNLQMSDNTHLRMQPNGHFRNCLIGVYDEENITIKGGFLHGEREEHDYNSGFVDSDGSTGASNGWLHCMRIKGGRNIVIDGVTFMDAAGDGISISSINHFFQPNHIRSNNITIKNCHFLRARRTNIVITSADDVYIEDNVIEDGGIDMENSTGTAPSSNLNIESFRSFDSDGNLIEYERVSRVYIKNNVQIVNEGAGSEKAGGFQISHAVGPIVIEDNEMINSGVGFFTADGVEIKNNTITGGGITAGSASNFDREDVIGNIVTGNKVVSSGTAISIAGNGVEVTNNSFEGEVGASFGPGATDSSLGASNINFRENTILASSRGVLTLNTMKNVVIANNIIELAEEAPFAAVLINRWDEEVAEPANFVFSNNTLLGKKEGSERGAPPVQFWGNSATIKNNLMGELEFGSGNNLEVLENKIEGAIHKSGINISKQITNTLFENNEVTIYPSLTNLAIECVKISDGVDVSTITFSNQDCIEK